MTNSKMQFKSLADMPGWEAAFTSSRDRVTESSGAYSLVPLIFRCLRLRCDALVSAPVVVENKRGNAVDWPYLVSPKRLFWGVQASMLMRGAAFIQKRANQLGGTADLYLLNPYSTAVTYNAAGVNFIYSGTNAAGESVSQTFTQENIIYIREYNPTDDIYPGPSAVGVALNDAALLRYIGRFGAKFFEQGAMPLTLVSVDSMDDRETERVTSWFKNFGTTIANAWRSFGTRAKLDIKTITSPLNTLALPELTAQARANIALAFGIPQTMLEDAANYATAKEHRLSFYQETVAPAGDIIMEYVNEQLFKSRGMTAHFDFESLDIYQEDEANRSSSLQALINAGLPLRLAMEILGYELTEEQEAELEEAEAEPAPAPVIVPQAEQTPDEDPMQEEIAKWQRKALKAYKAGKSPAVKFESDIIPDEMHAEIDAALATAQDEDAIKAAFHIMHDTPDMIEANSLALQMKRALDYLEAA